MSATSPLNGLSHFAINVEDEARAMKFYCAVFGWNFSAWGPPGFHLVDTGSEVHGAIQKVQKDPFPTVIGNFECSITVDDVDRVSAIIVAQGGEITLPKVTIPGVADIARVKDTEGNTFSIAKYLS
jgi:predicted enzyme related to lactoylglutathione lyase